MKTSILHLLHQFHELEIAPSAAEIYQNQDFKIDFQVFNAYLAHLAEKGILITENDRYALPGYAHLIEASWLKDLEIQYFINQFKVFTRILKLLPFIKGFGVAKNSFFKNSNDVYLNFIVEPATVHTTYFIVNEILKVFNRLSIFDAKVQFIFSKNEHIDFKTIEGFFAQNVHTVYGTYQFSNNTGKICKISHLVGLLFENFFKERASKKYSNLPVKNLFCNIEYFIERIAVLRKNEKMLYA